MWTAVITAVINIVGWFAGRAANSKVRVQRYIKYIKEWIKKTPTGAEISDSHDDLMSGDNRPK